MLQSPSNKLYNVKIAFVSIFLELEATFFGIEVSIRLLEEWAIVLYNYNKQPEFCACSFASFFAF